jgi:hypothetical protein
MANIIRKRRKNHSTIRGWQGLHWRDEIVDQETAGAAEKAGSCRSNFSLRFAPIAAKTNH